MPTLECPVCGNPTEFHEDEVEAVEDGTTSCMSCRLEATRDGFLMEILGGEQEEFVEATIQEMEDE